MISTLIKKSLTIIILILLLVAPPVKAETKNLVNIYFFHSKDCSHCQSESKILNVLEDKYNNIKIYKYEIHDKDNLAKYEQVKELYDIKTNGVPLTIIGDTPYQGYREELDDITFTKTIAYYSKYKYKDQLGEALSLETRTNYKVDNKAPSLDQFINDYGNYHLIGNIYTNDLNTSLNAILLAFLSKINPINIISIIIAILLINKESNIAQKLLLLTTYFLTTYLLSVIPILNNNLYSIIIALLLLILFILTLKQKKYNYNYLITLSIIAPYLEYKLFPKHLNIFHELLSLYNLTNLNKFEYYLNYLFIIIATNIILIVIIYYIIKIFNQKEKVHS